MKIAFVTPDLTNLRYFIPLADRLDRGDEVTFYLPRDNPKYNGLAQQGNYDRCVEILGLELPDACLTSDDGGEYDLILQVEVGNRLKGKRRISIQHGFDYAVWPDRLKQEVDGYIISPFRENEARLQELGISVIRPQLPICMWNSRLWFERKEQVTVFYPDQGDTDLASRVIDQLAASGLEVIVKQRRKHQSITARRGTHVYDDVWYPSEAIVHPLASRFTVGFGSSAYADLAIAGLNYINIDIHSHAWPWRAFQHPSIPNYVHITDEADITAALDHALGSMTWVLPVIDEEQLHAFTVGLTHVCDGDG